ncbi:MAG: hypothetical protein QM619_01755 [Micropruina sp.]|uniref:hypothetical protein n=1 Tax=Micropruina sp. TaxID=2737536 RepID=UPI0039E6B0C7
MADPTATARRRPAASHKPTFHHWSRRIGAVLLAGVLGIGLTMSASPAQAAGPGFCSDGSQPYVPVKEARAWQAGHAVTGKTVWQGTDPGAFTGSYIGFVADALGKGKDLLLFRLSNSIIDGTNGMRGAGIWAGMSGSPVYDGDGRLIGAVAYRLTTENLPIAGVTPAEYMKAIGTTAVTSARTVQLSRSGLKVSDVGSRVAGTQLTGSTLSQVATVNVAGPAGAKENAFTNRTLARTPRSAGAATLLRSGTFAAAPRQLATSKPLVAGGNVMVGLASGDLPLGSIGTVTAICGRTVWAFGHPMTQEGKVSMLLSNASVALVVPDGAGATGSYKQVSEIFAPVGMVTEDRRVGVRGTVGAVSGFPLTVDIQNPKGKQIDSYAVQIAYPDAAATAVATMVGQAALEQLDQVGSGSGQVTWTIRYKRANGKKDKLTNSQVIASRYYFPDEIGTPPADDVWAITDQTFEDATITGVDVTLKLVSADAIGYRVSKVQKFSDGKWATFAGSTLKTDTDYTLRPLFRVVRNHKPAGTRAGTKFTITLPKSAGTRGSVKVSAAGDSGSCVTDEFGEISCEDWEDPSASASSFDDLIAMLDAQRPHNIVSGKLTYRIGKTTKTKSFRWTGPGVMTGGTTANFTIKK